MWYALFGLGAFIVAGLAFYLGQILFQLRSQQQRQQQALLEQQKKQAEHQQYLLDSIVLIGKATLEQQCELSEAALRIWVLLENLQPDLAVASRWPGLFAMYDCVKAMPTHEARKQTDKKEIRRLDHIRQQMEIDLKRSIEQDIEQLLALLQQRH
ncbi:MAG: DUF2489 domain-containing protein [Gammaproteobacteria bacterium]|jgi:hypothetical protein|nr:DUF2489 domain-containing protein [Gammaproteobacteria bacterium]MBU2180586.1 DUF2489 domain-containing protein [Gammaproteobacteria bacterium]MBU2225963.1 DUF2489 domain-containing protein [Gammaproteobacteria bacterium]MBU2280931.1 DUF2489 domain-containing protein [Gammaproteobacteria bacterium]MBU2425583.1 DUF2489 domain-containing protein [Gammaproteobacteria bacterium]